MPSLFGGGVVLVGEDLRLQQIRLTNINTGFDILVTLFNEAIAEAHECADARILFGAGHQVLSEECALHPVCKRVQSCQDTKWHLDNKSVSLPLNYSTNSFLDLTYQAIVKPLN